MIDNNNKLNKATKHLIKSEANEKRLQSAIHEMNNGVHYQHSLIEDENLTTSELDLLKRGLKEALLIKEGKIKSIPFSELWND